MIEYDPPRGLAIEICYQDNSLLVVNKPGGLLSVPGKGEKHQDCLLTRIQQQYPDALIVHRLDMDTSGLLILARNKTIHRKLSLAFEARNINKRYIAITEGLISDDQGEIDLPLIADWPNRPKQIVDQEKGKASKTRFSILNRNIEENTSRVLLEPKTGRTHQLRVHLQSIGHPILGDRLYANAAALNKSERLLLHAEYLSFTHPESGELIEVHSPAPF